MPPKSDLRTQFQAHVKKRQLFSKGDRLIIATSGGADSVALCALCHFSEYHFEIAHCNFQLRGEECDRDEIFVRNLAEQYGVPFRTIRFDTKAFAHQHGISTQLAARKLRYEWFESLLEMTEGQASLVLTAHHADDDIETLLMNFFKGTGIQGLQGIPERRGHIIRPLLFARRSDIVNYLSEIGQTFVEDSSNLSDDYTRNYFRNHIIPALSKVIPQVESNLLHNIERFEDVSILYKQSLERTLKKLVVRKGNETLLPVLKLQKIPAAKTILFEVVKGYGFTSGQIPDIVQLLRSASGKFVLSASHRILRDRAWLIITPLDTEKSEAILIGADVREIDYKEGTLLIQKEDWQADNQIPADEDICYADASLISFPLLLRKWKEGDYFYPLGMEKKKKLSRFFIDIKLPVPDKERVWVIEQDKKIIWIVGYRMDNRFKVTGNTQHVIKFQVKK